MRVVTRLYFVDENNERFFGEGPYRLLREIEKTGSVRAAAADMGMAYTKAIRLVNNAEKKLDFKFINRVIGGKSGGGSSLTTEGREWLERYERYREACMKENERLFREYYGE